MNCYKDIFDASLLNSRQQATLTVVNLFAMIGNVIANALVIYIVIKTGQFSKITCKLVLMMSASNLLFALFCQSLLTALFYATHCSVVEAYAIFSVFLLHISSGYATAIIGVDRYLRIRYYAIFKTIWTTKKSVEINFNLVFSCFISSSDNYSRFVVGERTVCYAFLQYSECYCSRYNNNASNLNYPSIKCNA